jgi:hypothetical protein
MDVSQGPLRFLGSDRLYVRLPSAWFLVGRTLPLDPGHRPRGGVSQGDLPVAGQSRWSGRWRWCARHVAGRRWALGSRGDTVGAGLRGRHPHRVDRWWKLCTRGGDAVDGCERWGIRRTRPTTTSSSAPTRGNQQSHSASLCSYTDRWAHSSEAISSRTGHLGRPHRHRARVPPVGFQKSATYAEQRLYAARSYSLISPPRTGRRVMR